MVLRFAKAPVRAAFHTAFRICLHIQCWYADQFGKTRSSDPIPPAMLRFRVSESLAVDDFLRIGSGCATLIEQQIDAMALDLAHAHRVLDFGCGCARIMRWFLRSELENVEFHGVDVDREAIHWCQSHLVKGHFLATDPAPPLPYPDDHFDIVYCLSVFTHLDESMQDLWLRELMRVLKPGGAILISVHGNAAARDLDMRGIQTLQAKGFLHRRSKKLKGILPDWYQTTWHAEEYIISRVSRWFAEVRYRVIPDGAQDLVMARRPQTGQERPAWTPDLDCHGSVSAERGGSLSVGPHI